MKNLLTLILLISFASFAQTRRPTKKEQSPTSNPQNSPVQNSAPNNQSAQNKSDSSDQQTSKQLEKTDPQGQNSQTQAPENSKTTANTGKQQKVISPELWEKKRNNLIMSIKYGTSSERKAAVVEMKKFPKEYENGLFAELGNILEKENEVGIKILAIRSISALELESEKEKLVPLLKEKNDDLVREALILLKKWKVGSATQPILEHLKTMDLNTNSNLISTILSTLSDTDTKREATPFLLEKFKATGTNPDVKANIALYLGSVKAKEAEEDLKKYAFSKNEYTILRAYSINALGKLPSTSSIPELKNLLKELKGPKEKGEARKVQTLKIYSSYALFELGDKEALAELVDLSRDDDSLVRFRALEQLAKVKDPSTKELFEYKSNYDPSLKVQKYAKKVLETWDSKNADLSVDDGNDPSKEDPSTPESIEPSQPKKK